MSGDASMGVNTAMLASMQNAGSSALSASQKLKLFHFLAELDYHIKMDLSTIALPFQKQMMPGAGMVSLLPCLNNQGLLAKILAEILGKMMSRDEFADLLGEMTQQEFVQEEFKETDLSMLKQMASAKFAENAANSIIEMA